MENQTTLPSVRSETGEHPHEEESTIRQVTERGLDANQGDITSQKPESTSQDESREQQNDGKEIEDASKNAAVNLVNYCLLFFLFSFSYLLRTSRVYFWYLHFSLGLFGYLFILCLVYMLVD